MKVGSSNENELLMEQKMPLAPLYLELKLGGIEKRKKDGCLKPRSGKSLTTVVRNQSCKNTLLPQCRWLKQPRSAKALFQPSSRSKQEKDVFFPTLPTFTRVQEDELNCASLTKTTENKFLLRYTRTTQENWFAQRERDLNPQVWAPSDGPCQTKGLGTLSHFANRTTYTHVGPCPQHTIYHDIVRRNLPVQRYNIQIAKPDTYSPSSRVNRTRWASNLWSSAHLWFFVVCYRPVRLTIDVQIVVRFSFVLSEGPLLQTHTLCLQREERTQNNVE